MSRKREQQVGINVFATTSDLIRRFVLCREARVKGHEQFLFQRQRGQTIIVQGEDMIDDAIPAIRVLRAVELVRRNPLLYSNEPLLSHTTGAGHISNAVWSILHVMSLEELVR